jgi:TPR repeat protein
LSACEQQLPVTEAKDGVEAEHGTGEVTALDEPAGDLYKEGTRLFKIEEYESAVDVLTRSAKLGSPLAQRLLGVMYTQGKGVAQNYTEALKWYRMAAEQGDAESQSFVGWMYGAGKGVTQNYQEASKWCRMAAEQGDAEAQHNLGALYERGDGVEQSDQKALKWYRLSADQGDPNGLNDLAWLLATCPDPQLLDGSEAVRYALMAVEKAETYQMADTLAAAYARQGKFEQAVSNQTKAIAMVEAAENMPDRDKVSVDLKVRLDAYRNKKAWIEE